LVDYRFSDESDPVLVLAKHIRPRARRKILFEAVKVGSHVMLNHNYDDPTARGYWFDAVVTAKRNTRTIKELVATVYIGYLEQLL